MCWATCTAWNAEGTDTCTYVIGLRETYTLAIFRKVSLAFMEIQNHKQKLTEYIRSMSSKYRKCQN